MECMPRRLCLQYSDAIYHVMARGNGRQNIVRDDIDRDRLQEQLGKAPVRCSWHVYAFAIMSNHLHVSSKLRSLTSAAACSRFSRRMPTDGRVVAAFPGTSFIY
jgi:REP element-mobilizing transposase RayT